MEGNRYDDAVKYFEEQQKIEAGKGALVVGECMICGTISLINLDRTKDREVKLQDNTEQCYQCHQIKQRTPEVFKWVLNVISFAEYQKLNPRPEEAKPVNKEES